MAAGTTVTYSGVEAGEPVRQQALEDLPV